MSRSYKDKSDYLKDIKRNEDELNKVYLRSKNSVYAKNYRPENQCLDCAAYQRSQRGMCQECGDQSIEDLVSIYESMSA